MDSDNFFYTKEKGLMFEPLTFTHDEGVSHIIEMADSVSSEKIVKAFLSSLSTRRRDWRSGILSYYTAKLIAPHRYIPDKSYYIDDCCEVCRNLGLTGKKKYVKKDLNVIHSNRIRRGGTWSLRMNLPYILFDLEQFLKAQITEPTETDIAILKDILSAADSCSAGDLPGVLSDKLKDIPDFKSNKDERLIVVEILACMGVLNHASCDRKIKGKHDWHFAECWRGEDGYDAEAAEKYFGKYL